MHNAVCTIRETGFCTLHFTFYSEKAVLATSAFSCYSEEEMLEIGRLEYNMKDLIVYFFGQGTEVEFSLFTVAHFAPIVLMVLAIWLIY